jgi:hypothetical protein
MVLKDADSTPSVAVRKNGASVADSVTITKRSATTGIYDCSYNPASEVEGDQFTFEESATVTGTTTSSAAYTHQFSVSVIHAGAAVLDSATVTKIDSILEDTGTTLPALIGGSGTGARTVTITVDDGTTALQNATVRMTEGANTFTALTNVSGVAVFNLDDATYTVGVTKSGYSYAGTTLIVNGTETATYSMTVVSTPAPTQPDGCVIQVLCLNGVTPQQGVAIQYRAASIPSGDLNRAFLGTTQTATSNSSGIATFEVAQGSGFEWKRGDVVEWSSETAAVAASMDVRSVIGAVR